MVSTQDSTFFILCVNLCRQLCYVKECCEGEPEGDGVSALTSDERTRWAKVGGLMFGISANEIENSLCINNLGHTIQYVLFPIPILITDNDLLLMADTVKMASDFTFLCF